MRSQELPPACMCLWPRRLQEVSELGLRTSHFTLSGPRMTTAHLPWGKQRDQIAFRAGPLSVHGLSSGLPSVSLPTGPAEPVLGTLTSELAEFFQHL